MEENIKKIVETSHDSINLSRNNDSFKSFNELDDYFSCSNDGTCEKELELKLKKSKKNNEEIKK